MKKYALLFVAIWLLFVAGCARQSKSSAEVPRLLPQSYRIAVAPFTQPLNPGQLITGQIPEDQGAIPPDALLALDLDLRDVLTKNTHRHYEFLSASDVQKEFDYKHSTGQPGALPHWLKFGASHNAQLLLVPMIIDWHDREGSKAGVVKSAHARVEFFLLSIPEKGVMNRSIFEEKQVGLVDNLLTVGDFIKRKGQWVSARDLAVEAMTQAVKDLGL